MFLTVFPFDFVDFFNQEFWPYHLPETSQHKIRKPFKALPPFCEQTIEVAEVLLCFKECDSEWPYHSRKRTLVLLRIQSNGQYDDGQRVAGESGSQFLARCRMLSGVQSIAMLKVCRTGSKEARHGAFLT